MDENTLQEISRLREALKGLTIAADKSLHIREYSGASALHIKNYRRLYARALELLPDDAILPAYALDDDIAEPNDQLAQVQLLSEQMNLYLRGLLRGWSPVGGDIDDLRNMGGELRDQIITMTKRSLRHALSHVDFGMEEDDAEFDADIHDGPRKRKVKVRVEVDKSRGEDDDTTTL